MNPDKINLKFTSDLLLSDILLPFRTRSQNNAVAILDLFITTPQRTNKEPTDIIKTLFQITLTGVDVKGIINRTGRKQIPIPFYGIIHTRNLYIKESGTVRLTTKKWHNLKQNSTRFRKSNLISPLQGLQLYVRDSPHPDSAGRRKKLTEFRKQ